LAKNISAAEIAETDKKAKQLLKDLAGFQTELKNFREIKQRLGEVGNYNRKEPRRKPVKSQSGNIIPFPTVVKGEDATPSEKAGTGANVSSSISSTDLEQSLQEPPAEALEELLSQSNLSLPEETAAAIEATPVLEHFTVPEEDSTEDESGTGKLEVETPDRPLAQQAVRKVLDPAIEAEPRSMLPAEDTVSADAAIPEAEAKSLPPAAPSVAVAAPAESFETPPKPQPHAVRHGSQKDTEFDQGLLKELIKDYGEFDSYSTVSTTSTPAPENPSPSAAFKTVPPREAQLEETAEAPVKTANFDQEVRQLIKTYGKVDIYSTQGEDRKRLVTRSLVAAAVLGAALFGSYFFIFKESPKPVAPQVQSEPAAPQGDPVTAPSGDEKNAAKKANGNTANEIPNRR
jgi:hypothetical protein